jgi:ATP-dependent Lhr-like helicase
MLTLERLDRLAGRRPQRIGLSATVKPLEDVAAFLSSRAQIVHIGHRRDMELTVEVPRDELGPVASNEMWAGIYERLAELISANRTTLIFVNTRRLSERIAHHLGERLGPGVVLPHHGSLSRDIRLEAERKLKAGELRAMVATASLELGIDIGTVDLVCQIGSPRAISVALQRVGRAGHWVGGASRGRLFVTTRDELIECAALVRAIRSGELDRLEIPRNALDILAQQIVACCATEERGEDELFEMVCATAPYHTLPRSDFDAVVNILSEGLTTARGRKGAYLHRDSVNRRLRARRGARLTAITSGGAIPDTANYLVVAEPDGAVVGTLDEDFAIESLAGDVFLLGTTSWRIRRVEAGKVRVEDAHGAPPGIPFWRGEAPGRTIELSREVSALREEIAARTNDDAVAWLAAECGLDRSGAEQAVEYVYQGRAALGVLPATHTIVAERFFDEGGGMQLVLHSPFGVRINRAWGLALRKRFCRSFNFELQAAATDNGIVLSLGEQHSFPLDVVFEFVRPSNVKYVLTQAMLPAPMFGARWRWNATRALAIPRFNGGRKVPAPLQRMRADDLMAAVFPDQAACAENLSGDIRIPDHPLVKETIDNCLYEAMDLEGLTDLLHQIEDGRIRTLAIDTAEASPFSHEILSANPYAYLDDAPLEERRTRAVQLRRTLRTDVTDGAGALDPEAVRVVAEEAWPLVRNADELHEALLSMVIVPARDEWASFFAELVSARRATTMATFWIAAERLDLARRACPGARFTPPIDVPPLSRPLPESREACIAEILRGWFECAVPLRASSLSRDLALPLDLIEIALAQLEAEGQILRGHFLSRDADDEIEWAHRRLLARIHRLTIGRLRREIDPVTTTQFAAFLARWQHLAPGTQLHGVDGTLQVIRQLQGVEWPAAAWESEVLPRRIANYDSWLLDDLCLSGEVMWGRLSPHPAFDREPTDTGRRVRPTRVAPLALFLREDADWLLASPDPQPPESLSPPARELLSAFQTRGASFFEELVRNTRRPASEVEDALWELVAAGRVTADGFENLRALIDAPSRHRSRRRHTPGRWALLRHADPTPPDYVDRFTRQLLQRWGVVFRDIATRETLAPTWRDILVVLRRMETRGEIRGGRFAAAFAGEQFALPEALDLLRAIRRASEVDVDWDVLPSWLAGQRAIPVRIAS